MLKATRALTSALCCMILATMLYVFSLGPMCWLCEIGMFHTRSVALLYRPVIRAGWSGPDWMHDSLVTYLEHFVEYRTIFTVHLHAIPN